jgi:biopolymer transport protein ExbD
MFHTDERPQGRNRRRRFQFGLSALLLATAFIAILVAWQRPRIDRWLESLRDRPVSSGTILILKIDSDGGFVLGNKLQGMHELKSRLAKEMELFQLTGQAKPALIVTADAAAPFDRVRNMMEIAREAGFSEIELHQVK